MSLAFNYKSIPPTAVKNDKYVVEASSSLLKFEFDSEGPKGRIRKQIVFRAFENAPTVFNLGFGDVNEDGEINDKVVTDNQDSQKVLGNSGVDNF